MHHLLSMSLLAMGCTNADPSRSQATDAVSRPADTATEDATSDSGPHASPLQVQLGIPVDFSEPGDLRDSHAVGEGLGEGFLIGWTAEIPMGGTQSVPLRLTGPDLDDVVTPGPSTIQAEAPAMVPVGDGVAVAMTDIVQRRTGVRQVTAAGELGPIRWLDGAEAPRFPFASDIAAAPDGSTWTLWSETLWSLTMSPDDMAKAPPGRYRLAHVGPTGELLEPPEPRWETAAGGKHPPDVAVLADGSVVCAVGEREAVGTPAEVVLHRVSDDLRLPVSAPGRDASRPHMATDDDGRLAVVWREGQITDLESFIGLYDQDLTLLAGPLPLEPDWTSDRPTVVPHPEGWLVAWERPDPIDSDGTEHRELRLRVLSADGSEWRTPVAAFDSTDRRRRPSLARNGERTLLLWEQGPNDDTFIRGALVDVVPDTP